MKRNQFSGSALSPQFGCGVTVVSWSNRFDEPTALPTDRKLATLRAAAAGPLAGDFQIIV